MYRKMQAANADSQLIVGNKVGVVFHQQNKNYARWRLLSLARLGCIIFRIENPSQKIQFKF